MTDGSPVYSIVTPSFNQGQFLTETIESFIGQAGEFTQSFLFFTVQLCDTFI